MSLLSKGLKILRGSEKKAARTGAQELAVRAPVKPKAPVKPESKAPTKVPVKPKPKPVPKKPLALPAPKKVLALPAPGPGLPDFAAKPKGGQWWTPDSPLGMLAPSEASRDAVYLSERFASDPASKEFLGWWDKAFPKYLQNDFATPTDPLRELAPGAIPGVPNADYWSDQTRGAVIPMPLQKLLFESDPAVLRDPTLAAMPWVSKVPATDSLYGVDPQKLKDLEFGHVRDEMRNALNPNSGLPADLAVRPESLGRMSFPQAVERVGRINQWRAKEAERTTLSNLNSPAVQLFKEYPENNPGGLRWVELRQPELPDDYAPPGLREYRTMDGQTRYALEEPDGGEITGKTREDVLRGYYPPELQAHLQDALRYEGDTMGHCVGGYCDDVASGRSRIFSLRDARGEPHVTIETAPKSMVYSDLRAAVGDDEADRLINAAYDADRGGKSALAAAIEAAGLQPKAQDIVQIKGKQNRAPNPEYLPFVQDFVKSGQWGDVGDLQNTGLRQLPDKRYITGDQYNEVYSKLKYENPEIDLGTAMQLNWPGVAHHFEGFAVGGRVRANPYRIAR